MTSRHSSPVGFGEGLKGNDERPRIPGKWFGRGGGCAILGIWPFGSRLYSSALSLGCVPGFFDELSQSRNDKVCNQRCDEAWRKAQPKLPFHIHPSILRERIPLLNNIVSLLLIPHYTRFLQQLQYAPFTTLSLTRNSRMGYFNEGFQSPAPA